MALAAPPARGCGPGHTAGRSAGSASPRRDPAILLDHLLALRPHRELDKGAAGRLHLLLGNHDIPGRSCSRVVKDGLVAREGLVLQHRRTGQQIFVVHGHQADIHSDRLHPLSQFVVRNIWKRILLLRATPPNRERALFRVSHIERRIADWAAQHRQVVICGHTHRPAWPTPRSAAYFNTGSCVYPGYITGLEMHNGEIALVRWVMRSEAGVEGGLRLERELLAPPQALALLL